ncbi:hypothetical protein F4782DRAFT_36521 [Xylaria castorea]|nr:hypothetical protein F4782DRAFT_36521 [Xylaria castorea]
MMLARSLISTASRAGTRGAPLTRTHPNLDVPSISIDIPGKINICATRHNGIISRRSLSTGASSLSTPKPAKKDVATNATKNGLPSQPSSGSQQTSSPSEDDFKISFHNLGMNRTTKFVVYAVVGVLGTMETIFWCKVLWHWWTGNEEDVDE